MKKKGKVIINPLIGMKKKGDFKNEVLLKVFTNLITNNEYKNKFFLIPLLLICTMLDQGKLFII